MSIDPRISLAADAGSIGNIFSNALSTAQQAQTLRQNRELAPILYSAAKFVLAEP